MREKQKLSLLREYVKEIITEDDGGDVAADLMGGAVDASPYGMSYGGKSVASVFVEPFTDVFKVGMGKTKELAVRAQTLAKVAFEAIVTSVLPIFSDDYAKIFANEKKQLDSLKQEYQDVYNAVWETFDHNDLKLLAFMYDPLAAGGMLNYFGGKAGLSVAIDAVDALTGGWLKDTYHLKTSPKKKHTSSHGGAGSVQEESVNRLDESKMADILHQAMENPRLQAIREQASKIVRGTLSAVMKQAQATLSANSLHQLIGGGESSQKAKQALSQLQQVPEADRKNAEALLLKTIKRSFKEFYLKNLEGQVKKAVESGVPQTSAYVRDYTSVINKIKSM